MTIFSGGHACDIEMLSILTTALILHLNSLARLSYSHMGKNLIRTLACWFGETLYHGSFLCMQSDS